MAELLIEIFTEELPALPLLKNLQTLRENWTKILKQNHLETHFDFFYTPRRLTFIHRDFALKQPNTQLQSYGPPLQIAYNEDKTPSKAMQSFLQKNGIAASDVRTVLKDGKEVLFYEKEIVGNSSADLLGDMVISFLQSLNFGKTMRWGNTKDSFIRPIRNICILLDSVLIPCNAYGVQSSRKITAHRQARDANGQIMSTEVQNIQSYLDFLEQNGVILDQEKRREIILRDIKKLEETYQVTTELDLSLLAEIVAITEYPTVLFGTFEERFLKIPKEMIITSMKENQRYFALYKEQNLYNGFIVVSNAFEADFALIVQGNEKVLRARLQDAEFFYENDLKAQMNFGDLSKIGFLEGAGNLHDKIMREQKLVKDFLCLLQTKQKHFDQVEQDYIQQALLLAKCDLLSQSVGEFPELQGIMGADFAKHMQQPEAICLAIKEQYLPHGLDVSLPSNEVSAVTNLAIKLDTIFTLFQIGKIPTGSKDPFALRRQSSALLRICHQYNFDVTIKELCLLCTKEYNKVQLDSLNDFILERIYGIFPQINASVVRAVLVREFGIAQSFHTILALGEYFQNADIRSIISTFKRVANILEKEEKQVEINETLFEESEKALYVKLAHYVKHKTELLSQEKVLDSKVLFKQIQALFELKTPLDHVFDSVLIHTDDSVLRANRIALITLVFNEFNAFGDMREISI